MLIAQSDTIENGQLVTKWQKTSFRVWEFFRTISRDVDMGWGREVQSDFCIEELKEEGKTPIRPSPPPLEEVVSTYLTLSNFLVVRTKK